jgi:hypothetical protein
LGSSLNVIGIIEPKSMRWAEQVARMGVMRNVYKILVGKHEVKRTFDGSRQTRGDKNEIELGEIGQERMCSSASG